MKVAGLDIGTTGCKCTVFDGQGRYLDKAYRDYPVRRAVGGHEIDISAVMDGVYAAVREMTARYPDIAGLGVTSFGETFVMTDGDGIPLHPAMLYTDPRGKEECRVLTDRLGGRKIARITGLRPHEMYSISKIMWIRNHQPDLYRAAEHVFLMEDYVVFHLTGRAQIDYFRNSGHHLGFRILPNLGTYSAQVRVCTTEADSFWDLPKQHSFWEKSCFGPSSSARRRSKYKISAHLPCKRACQQRVL